MFLSVAICTSGRPIACAAAVTDVLAQLGDGELLVVDQSPRTQREALSSLLPPDPRLRLVHSPVRSLTHARNEAIRWTRGPVLVFLDDDVRLGAGCLDAHRAALVDPSVGGVVGRIHERIVRPNRPPVVNRIGPGGRVLTNLDGSYRGAIDSLKGCNMGFRRDWLLRAGGFDRRFGGTAFLEDADVSERVLRAGGALRFVPEAELTHLSAPSGGVRLPERVHLWWRFHNTGLFLASHRARVHVLRGRLTFAAIAARWSVSRGDLHAAGALVAAFDAGTRLARTPAALLSGHSSR